MKHYEFTITLSGCGDDVDEAWQDAVEGFIEEPGSVPDDSQVKVEDKDE